MKAKGIAFVVIALVLLIPFAFFGASVWVNGASYAGHLAATGGLICTWLVLVGCAAAIIYGA